MDSQIFICSRQGTAPRFRAQMMEKIIDKVGNLLVRPLVVWCQSRVERVILGRLRLEYGMLNDRNTAEGRKEKYEVLKVVIHVHCVLFKLRQFRLACDMPWG
jgi:hypothetical protein